MDHEAYLSSVREVRKVITKAKLDKHDKLYRKLDTRDEKKGILRLVKIRERRSRVPQHVRCVQDKNGKVFTKKDYTRQKWKECFQNC